MELDLDDDPAGQLVYREARISFQEFDWRHLEPQAQEQAIAEWLVEERQQSIDWRVAPLARFFVHRRSESSFQFTLTFHHAILDGWSAASMLAELFRHYLMMLAGDAAEMARPQVAYREFIAQRRKESAVPLERAITRGELPLDVDVELVLDLLVAPLFYRAFVSHEHADDAYVTTLVETVLRAVSA